MVCLGLHRPRLRVSDPGRSRLHRGVLCVWSCYFHLVRQTEEQDLQGGSGGPGYGNLQWGLFTDGPGSVLLAAGPAQDDDRWRRECLPAHDQRHHR